MAESKTVEVKVTAKYGLDNGKKFGEKCFLPEATAKILEGKKVVEILKTRKVDNESI